VRVSSSARHARSARPASWGPRLAMPALTGEFSPAPSRRLLMVERRAGKRWQRVTRVRTSRSGHYRVNIGRAGTYRVRSGRLAGPPVRIR
jgi:hypothetical protein